MLSFKHYYLSNARAFLFLVWKLLRTYFIFFIAGRKRRYIMFSTTRALLTWPYLGGLSLFILVFPDENCHLSNNILTFLGGSFLGLLFDLCWCISLSNNADSTFRMPLHILLGQWSTPVASYFRDPRHDLAQKTLCISSFILVMSFPALSYPITSFPVLFCSNVLHFSFLSLLELACTYFGYFTYFDCHPVLSFPALFVLFSIRYLVFALAAKSFGPVSEPCSVLTFLA